MTIYAVPDMSCGHCKATITAALLAQDPQAKLSFDMAARTVTVQTTTPQPEVRAALDAAGYPATPV